MDTLTITLLFILISAMIVVITRKIKKDRCLKDFKKNIVILEKRDGEKVKGRLTVASTGLELNYLESVLNEFNFSLFSFLLYKSEYHMVQLLIRFLDDLSDEARVEREKDLKRTFHPSKLRKFFRKVANFFRTIKDSLMEIFNLMSNHVGKNTAVGMVMASQDKYIDRIKHELFTAVDNSFEPLLEKYIGYRVIVELDRGEKGVKYNGILKRYTGEFIELIDVDYIKDTIGQDEVDDNKGDVNNNGGKQDYGKNEKSKKADLVVPRRYGIVRGLAEKVQL